MTLSIRLTENEKRLVESYAKIHGVTVSEAVKSAFFEKLEDEFDIADAEIAYEDFKKDSKTYSLQETKELLDLE